MLTIPKAQKIKILYVIPSFLTSEIRNFNSFRNKSRPLYKKTKGAVTGILFRIFTSLIF